MSYNSVNENGPAGHIVSGEDSGRAVNGGSTASVRGRELGSTGAVGTTEDASVSGVPPSDGTPVNRRVSTDSLNSDDLETQPLIRGQLLDPDDPKVSPLNLYHIKTIKFIIWLMWVINCVMFFILLLSDFISIPGLNNRGRSFLEIDLVILSALTNLLTLWCFVVPAYYERVLGYISSGLLVIDFIVMISVTYLRHQFGGIGNFLLIWTLLTILLNCYADYKVESGKKFQEIRYTGRPETRKTFTEAFVISIKFIIKLVLLVIIWNISLSLWIMAFDTHVKPPGEMILVNNDQFKVHLDCYGDFSDEHMIANEGVGNNTQPIILVEGGQAVSSEEFLSWIEELYDLNKVERYCIWDRPGYGFSDSAPSPISVSIIIDYLNEALVKKGISGPFALVGFDVGGLYSRMFASKNPGKVDSIMLVDSWHEDLLRLKPFRKSELYKFPEFDLMTTFNGVKLWFKGLVSPLGLVTNIHWFLHPKLYSSKVRIYGSDMVYQSQYLRARLQEQITASVLSYNEVAGTDISDIPLYVMSSDYMIKRSKNWGDWQRRLTKLSTAAQEWTIIEKANHFIYETTHGKQKLQEVLLRMITGL